MSKCNIGTVEGRNLLFSNSVVEIFFFFDHFKDM